MSKIICPFHEDHEPSMEIYDNGGYCFSCGKSASVAELKAYFASKEDVFNYPFQKRWHMGKGKYDRPKEDIAKSLERINALPRKEIRGFLLPYDDTGYYLVWPDQSYYLKRLTGETKNKYKGPAGHKRPLWHPFDMAETDQLVVVEGEFNAYSALRSNPLIDVVSPGAASNFGSQELLDYCLNYDKILIVVDRDAAGVLGGLELKGKLLEAKKRCVLFPVERDFNDLLITEGAGAVKQQIEDGLKLL